MSTCTANQMARKLVGTCPVNGKPYNEVGRQTILHHIRKPWHRHLAEQHYFFCTDAQCDVVYFGEDNSCVLRDDVWEDIGQKQTHPQRKICYCFDINWSDIERNPQQCKQFVIAQTQHGQCACRTRNPSGKCCLRDFPA